MMVGSYVFLQTSISISVILHKNKNIEPYNLNKKISLLYRNKNQKVL